jgi:DeoR family transcriptional regulator, fructose operon transcriptional repressor
MLVEKRRDELLEMIRVRRFATLPELAGALAVSESTVRRDLEYLEEQGTTRRIHGGVLYAGSSPKLSHFDAQDPAQWVEKTAIARLAATLVQDGDTVLIGGGSTAYEVARLLLGRPLHVLTNSLPVANLFAGDTKSDLVLIGGNICPRTGVVRGPYANQMLAQVRVRKAIVGTAAISPEGLYNNDLLIVETEQAILRAATESIVVAESAKFGHESLGRLCPLSSVRHLVVDSHLSQEWRERVRAAGVNLLVAEISQDE